MKKLFSPPIYLFVCLSALLVLGFIIGCKTKTTESRELRQEHPIEMPLRLSAEEAEFWKKIILVNIDKPGIVHPYRVALFADGIILELRKRTGGEK
jgi:hypothetical protein